MILSNVNVTVLTIVLSCIGVVIIGVVLIILNKFVFRKHKARSTLNEIERKYQYLHSILIGKDFQILQRIDQISRTNIIYMDIHTTYFKRFKDVRDVSDKMYGEIVRQLGNYVEDNKIKEFFALYKEKAPILKSYETNINSLHNDLINLIKPEEEAREAILSLKDKSRELKSLYNNKEYDLFIVADSFKNVFEKIESYFKAYDNYVENASYEEAKNLLPVLDNVLSYLITNINTLPSIIRTLTNDLQQKINNLKDRYKELTLKGYPLQNINFDYNIKTIERLSDEALKELKKININKTNKLIDEIENNITSINTLFDNEIDAKQKFDEKHEQVLKKFLNIDKSFMNISNYLDKIKKYYLIDEEKLNFFKTLSSKMDEVNNDKRRLDIYLHSKDPTPYSILTSKVLELEKGTDDVTTKYNDFIKYIESLKSDSERIFKKINTKYLLLKEYETKLLNINNKNFVDEMNARIDDCYYYVDEIFNSSQIIPINVKTMNELDEKLETNSNIIFEKVDDMIEAKNKTRDNVLLINGDRLKFSDINTLLCQVENFYNEGNYLKSFEMSVTVLNKLKEKSGQIN